MQQRGWDVTYLPVKTDGLVDLDQLHDAIRPDTAIVSVMYVNNEIGESSSNTARLISPAIWQTVTYLRV